MAKIKTFLPRKSFAGRTKCSSGPGAVRGPWAPLKYIVNVNCLFSTKYRRLENIVNVKLLCNQLLVSSKNIVKVRIIVNV